VGTKKQLIQSPEKKGFAISYGEYFEVLYMFVELGLKTNNWILNKKCNPNK